MDFRDRIKEALAKNPDLSMRQASIKAGSDSLLHKVLNPDKRGGIKSPTLDKIEDIANALHVDPAWLAFGSETRLPNANVLTGVFQVLLDSLDIDPDEGERARKLALAFPDALRSMTALHAKARVDVDLPREEAPRDGGVDQPST